MKIMVLLVFAACFLMAGCVEQIKPEATNVSTVTQTFSFDPFAYETVPTPGTITISNSTATPKLKGSLKISLYSWMGEFPVSVDNVSAGRVATHRPLTLLIEEGNHTVEVCCCAVCEQENVTIVFGEQRVIDFSERAKKNCEFLEPTVRIVDYFVSGDEITVNLEFINPTMNDLTLSAKVSCGYSFIESRTNNRVGSSATGQVFSTVNAYDRVTKPLKLYLASGSNYIYEIPTITQISSQ